MARSLSATAKQSIFAQETAEVWIMLITIDHADLASPIRIARNNEDVTSNGDTYTAFPFKFTFPSESDESLGQVTLEVANATNLLVEGVRSISSPLSVVLQAVLASDPDTVEAGPVNMSMTEVRYNAETLSGVCKQTDFLNQKYPKDSYTPADYPGLF